MLTAWGIKLSETNTLIISQKSLYQTMLTSFKNFEISRILELKEAQNKVGRYSFSSYSEYILLSQTRENKVSAGKLTEVGWLRS